MSASESEVRTKILEAAADLFAAGGYEGTTVREIASTAGVNLAMIHYYFGNKEGLYRSLFEDKVETVREIIERAESRGGTSAAQLEAFVREYIRFLCEHPSFASIAQREMLKNGQIFREVFLPQTGRNYAVLRGIIAEGVRRGELRQVDIDLAPLSLIGMIAFFVLAHRVTSKLVDVAPGDAEFVERLTRHTIDLFLNGITATELTPPRDET